jgi:hypothetical protein
MKRYIFIFVLFCGIFYMNVSGKEATWWYGHNMSIGVFSKVEMTDENHMQFEISFADSDYTIKRRSNYSANCMSWESVRPNRLRIALYDV